MVQGNIVTHSAVEITPKKRTVQIEISVDSLERLFLNGQLCAAEFSCLDVDSKQAVQKLCLNACVHRLQKAQ
ncbi:hypothetical protein EH171_17915 [Enterovibrio baiacu]|nr:hypothetical protein [Enterovibrio baiacu]